MAIAPDSLSLLEMHALNGAQRQADSAANVAEASRLGYLESKTQLNQREALATRSADVSLVARDALQLNAATKP